MELLRLHPVWKDGDHTHRLMVDPFFHDLLGWWKAKVAGTHGSCGCARNLPYARGVLMTALFTLSVRSSRLLAYLLKNPGFLLSDESCLPELYRNVIMGKGVFIGLKDTSSSPRNTATTEPKCWSTGALMDSILVPCWERPDKRLDPLLRAQTVVDFAHDLVVVSKFKGCLAATLWNTSTCYKRVRWPP